MFKLNGREEKKLLDLGVSSLILFGSQAQGIANENSDYDFFVIGPNTTAVYDQLYNLLSDKINKLVDIDIVFDEEAPMELKNHVSKYGKILFQSNHSIFPNFKQGVMLEYADFEPYRKMFNAATIARID